MQGGASLRPHLDGIGRSLGAVLAEHPAVPVVLVETGLCHRDDAFADALSAYLDPARLHRLPRGFVVDDVVAAIAHSRGFLGSSLHGCITAHVLDRPFVVLDLLGQSKLSSLDLTGDGELVSSVDSLGGATTWARRRQRPTCPSTAAPLADAHFDRLAALAQTSRARRAA